MRQKKTLVELVDSIEKHNSLKFRGSKAQRELGFSPEVTLREEMHKVAEWVTGNIDPLII